MSNPHKFYAELLSTYAPTLFSNKVSTKIFDHENWRGIINNNFRYDISRKCDKWTAVLVKCKSFSFCFVINHSDETLLDRPFDECPVVLEFCDSGYNHYNKLDKTFHYYKDKLILIHNIVSMCPNFSNKKYLISDDNRNIKSYETSSKLMALNIDFKKDLFELTIPSLSEEFDFSLTDNDDIYYSIKLSSISQDSKNKTSEIKKVIKEFTEFKEIANKKLIDGVEKIRQELMKEHAELYGRDLRIKENV